MERRYAHFKQLYTELRQNGGLLYTSPNNTETLPAAPIMKYLNAVDISALKQTSKADSQEVSYDVVYVPPELVDTLVAEIKAGNYKRPYTNVKEISMTSTNIFEDRLMHNIFPNLERVEFVGRFNQPLSPGSIPQQVKHLKFVGEFNQAVYAGVLPRNLETLEFDMDFDDETNIESLIPVEDVPPSLKVLSFERHNPFLASFYRHKLRKRGIRGIHVYGF